MTHTPAAIEFFQRTAGQTAPAIVFGRGDSFILLALGTGELADPEIVIDGLERGFKMCGYVGECRICGRIVTFSDREAADSALPMLLAPSRYQAWVRSRARQVAELESLHEL